MGFSLLHRIYDGASITDEITKTYREIWLLDSIDDANEWLFSLKGKNNVTCEKSGDKYAYFVIDDVQIKKRPPMAGGKIQMEASFRERFFDDFDEIRAPWELPPFNYAESDGLNEESCSQFYPGNDDILLPESFNPQPFINTAGVPLEGTTTYVTTNIKFSYAISYVTFELIRSKLWSCIGKINNDNVTICGQSFPARTVRLEGIDKQYCELTAPGVDPTTHEPIVTTYHYFRLDVSLMANPRTWNQYFLNVGTHVNRNGVISRLWNWENPSTGKMVFGTYTDYIASGAQDGQAVAEPVALNANGTNASGLGTDGRQIMTYRHGSMYEPISFTALGFPTAPPKKWRYDA